MTQYSNNDAKYVSLAVNEAEKSSLRAKTGCVAVVSGKVMARGYNTYRTFSKDGLIKQTCSCHAEIDVLRKISKQNVRGKINLYIIRVTNNGDLGCSAPCIECTETMKQFNIKTLTYVTNDGDPVKKNFNEYFTDYKSSGAMAILHKRIKCI